MALGTAAAYGYGYGTYSGLSVRRYGYGGGYYGGYGGYGGLYGYGRRSAGTTTSIIRAPASTSTTATAGRTSGAARNGATGAVAARSTNIVQERRGASSNWDGYSHRRHH